MIIIYFDLYFTESCYILLHCQNGVGQSVYFLIIGSQDLSVFGVALYTSDGLRSHDEGLNIGTHSLSCRVRPRADTGCLHNAAGHRFQARPAAAITNGNSINPQYTSVFHA